MAATALVAAAMATAPFADARAIAGQAGATAAAANSPDRARRGGWGGGFGSADVFQRDADVGCDPGQEEDAGLCYKACKAGFQGVGPVCWATCRPGYTNHGALCNKDNGFAKSSYGNGWGTVMKPQGCRAGYTNTGLLCSRCTGGWPWEWSCSTYAQKLACDAGLEQDGALCYPPCKAGYYSVGPVCWQGCPSTHTDIGTICTDIHVYAKDTYGRGVGVPMRERYGPIKPITHQSANSGAASIFRKITEGTCESAGLAPIDDDDLCTKAAAALGHTITWGPHGGYPDVPRGCTVRAQTQLFRNPAASSTQGAPCSARNACVCRRGKDLDDAFTIVFISDLEDNYRGHTTHNSRRIVQSIADLKRLRNVKFDVHPEHVVNPELVIHGGDISKDSWKCEGKFFSSSDVNDCHMRTKEGMIDYQLEKVWGPLEEQRIPMVSALGNHDWHGHLKRVEGADWLGDSKEKHMSNLVSVEFARRTYKRAAEMTDQLSYKEYAPQKKFGQVFINAEFRGVQIANFMEDFDAKSYEFDGNKDCTAAGSDYGLGGCTAESAGSQYDEVVNDLDRSQVTLAVVHKPISPKGVPCGSDPSTFTTAQVDKFVGMLSEFPRGAAVLSGHTHCFKETPHVAPNGREIIDYTAPYPWTHKNDADGKGGYIAMLISPTRGILETKRINSGL